ncbi:MAG: hypothetical protein C0601_10475 [Candidatus Muiribacterium halophilum]|uniref:Uncharacterized protein n=1 Tax=Muiribacterium halophilum TaxID=2053465 RepID=A0A2N5ZCK0_MUIH1|nr:MAG: hypothetical protein C0601_10475 [Candidatus Muirbacterium halophilum]
MRLKDLLKIEKGIAYAVSFFLFIPFSYKFYEPFVDIKRGLSFPLILILGILFFLFKKKVRVSKSYIILSSFTLILSLSIIWSANRSLTFFSITRYMFFLIVLLVFQNSHSLKRTFFKGVFISACLLGVYVFFQAFKIDPFHLGARVATIGNSNYLGVILLFFTSFFFYEFVNTKKKFDLILFIFFSIALVFGARMRSAVLAFFAGLTIFSFYRKNKIFISVMIIVMVIGVVIISGELMKGKASFWIRYYIGRDSIKGVLSSFKTAVFGFGENSYLDSFNKFRSVDAFRVGGKNIYSITSHNIFIDVFFELGLVGLAVFVYYLIFLFNSSEKKQRLILLTFLIVSSFLNPLKHISTSILFFIPLIMLKRGRKVEVSKNIFIFIIILLAIASLFMECTRLKNSFYAMKYFQNKQTTGELTEYDSGLYLFEKANYFRRKKDYKKAEVSYLKCLKKLPEFVPALLNTGQLYYNMKKDGKALKYYEKVIGINPEHPDAWFFKGAIKYNNMQYKESVRSLEKAYLLSGKKDKQALELLLKIKRRTDDILDK